MSGAQHQQAKAKNLSFGANVIKRQVLHDKTGVSRQTMSMPGRLFLDTDTATLAHALSATPPALHQIPRANMAPGQQIVVLTADRHLAQMRWGIVPVGRVNARGRPVLDVIVNARSETVFAKSAFIGTARAIVPAHGWYEWTGEKRHKTAWRIRRPDHGLIAFAAITDLWTAPGGQALWQVATVTCAPSADVRAVHDRMGVILDPNDFETWLTGTTEAATALMKPAADGSLVVEPATKVDWTAP